MIKQSISRNQGKRFCVICGRWACASECRSSRAYLQDNKTDRYFGFVNFETAEAAVAAKEKLHDSELDGSKLFVDRAQTKAERSDMLKRRYEQKRSALAQEWEGKNVYVKNLSAEVDETMLKEAFAVRSTTHPGCFCASELAICSCSMALFA